MPEVKLSASELLAAWPVLNDEDRLAGFRMLDREEAEELFDHLDPTSQYALLLELPERERRIWMRFLDPDDAADLIQAAEPEHRPMLLALLDDAARKEVAALLAYAEDEAGGLMNPRFARLRPEMNVEEAIRYLRRQKPEQVENLYYAYVLDQDQRLLGVVSLRTLLLAPPEKRVREVMETDLVTVDEELDQERVSALFAEHDLIALPVVDRLGRMKGIITVDDIVDVVQEEATEDIQKFGGTEALDAPYLQTELVQMWRKRVGWLVALLIGETLTVTAMQRYEHQIARAVVLALFVPLVISGGGNSGSQAGTLVIRAMALGELRLRDWWRVVRRELLVGLALGSVLGSIGFLCVLVWNAIGGGFGEHYVLVGATVGCAVAGVVLWGTLAGSTLPFVLRSLGFDPACASGPLVATLLDFSGLLIYFTVAQMILRGTLL